MRRLIVCCDGTWNTPDDDDATNVARMARAIAPVDDDKVSQIVYYDSGIGSGNPLDFILGGVFGNGISANIKEAYRFLVHNYVEDDEIFLFGFSRGAFTVRSLAGLLRSCGIVRGEHADQIEEAWDTYRIYDPKNKADHPAAKEFRRKYSHLCDGESIPTIKFVGVWDTVGALGVPVGRILGLLSRVRNGFHDVTLSRYVQHGYHALAIDEPRFKFEPSLWLNEPDPNQKIEQVWFPGSHSDVGGGYLDRGLSDLTWKWMMEKAAACDLQMSKAYLAREGPKPDLAKPPEDSRFSFTKFFMPKNVRDVARNPHWSEKIHPGTIEKYQAPRSSYRPEGLVEWHARPARGSEMPFRGPEPPPLRRGPVIGFLRWFFGCDRVNCLDEAGWLERQLRTFVEKRRARIRDRKKNEAMKKRDEAAAKAASTRAA